MLRHFTCQEQIANTVTVIGTVDCIAEYWCHLFLHELWYCKCWNWVMQDMALGDTQHGILYRAHCLSKLHHSLQQMYLSLLLEVCQWWHWMNQARSESLGADQRWDLVKWSLVTLCSTGDGEPPLTQLAQCLALVQPHILSPTSILIRCMKWELHQWVILDWVDTAVGVGSKWQLTTVSELWSMIWYVNNITTTPLILKKPSLTRIA